jgi:hypothetical protein
VAGRAASKNARRARVWTSMVGGPPAAFSETGAATVIAGLLGADWLPSRSRTTIGPEAAASGTRTLTAFLLRRSGAAATSSASPGAPWKTTSNVRPRYLPRSRRRAPLAAVRPSAQPLVQRHDRMIGAGRMTTPGGGAESCGCASGSSAEAPPVDWPAAGVANRSAAATTIPPYAVVRPRRVAAIPR